VPASPWSACPSRLPRSLPLIAGRARDSAPRASVPFGAVAFGYGRAVGPRSTRH
jgi:hypothetical protein